MICTSKIAEFFRRELERRAAARENASRADTNPECKCAYHVGIAALALQNKGLDSLIPN